MKMDSRGRVRFGWRGVRVEVSRNGVNTYCRSGNLEWPAATTSVMHHLCNDHKAFRKFCEACAIVAMSSDVPCMCGHPVAFKEIHHER